ncbi:MAG: ANR family transcriptional regulator [Vibrio sp.]|uniref:ANR family transcriptional regulator n=1 Tax=Vibrio sp. TaxID=678 RepID=UPI003A8A6B98
MNHDTYHEWAQRACEKERQQQWFEAQKLWLKAFYRTSLGDINRHWSWARADFCNSRRHNHHWHW